jgi:hypothetical protein
MNTVARTTWLSVVVLAGIIVVAFLLMRGGQ